MANTFDMLPMAISNGEMERSAPIPPGVLGGDPFTTQAACIVNRVEREIIECEDAFGHSRLLGVVSGFGRDAYVDHVRYYRQVIRESQWPHEVRIDQSHAGFLKGFERSSSAYVEVSFTVLRHLGGATDLSIDEVYDDALAAEALRGQFGKSSPDGLDRRLDQLMDQFLDIVPDEDILVLVGTPPIRTAESALVEDFRAFRRIFTFPPTISDVLGVDAQHRATVWRFLRRHVRWDFSAIAPFYREGIDTDFDSDEVDFAHCRRVEQRRRAILEVPAATLGLIDQITSLNVLNLVLEPAFSFKGCVGLPLGMIFRQKRHVEQHTVLDQEGIRINKWKLFNRVHQEDDQ